MLRILGTKVLLDDNAILAYVADVDLSPIRAGLTLTLGEHQFTSVPRRIQSLEQESQVSAWPERIDRVDASDEASTLGPMSLKDDIAPTCNLTPTFGVLR